MQVSGLQLAYQRVFVSHRLRFGTGWSCMADTMIERNILLCGRRFRGGRCTGEVCRPFHARALQYATNITAGARQEFCIISGYFHVHAWLERFVLDEFEVLAPASTLELGVVALHGTPIAEKLVR